MIFKMQIDHLCREAMVARRLPLAVDWSPDIKWAPELTIRGASYPIRSLFDVKPSGSDIALAKPDMLSVSPQGTWAYCEKLIPTGTTLQTLYGLRKGDVMFDAPVLIPALHEQRYGRYEFLPWMSLTPMEMISLRGGTKRAKGTTIVAGLGLGHQLIEVSKRRQVKKLILIERCQELVDWLMPKITPYLGQPVEVIVGDVYKTLPALAADVALIDVFPSYGGNSYERDKLRRECKRVGHVWAWGAAG